MILKSLIKNPIKQLIRKSLIKQQMIRISQSRTELVQ